LSDAALKDKELVAKIKQIILGQLTIDADKVVPEASFTEDLGADSLDVVELVMAFEQEFGIEISDENAGKIKTVKDVIDHIEELINK
jgi:acyl carrier protein